jgi:hypothetical protein
MVKMRETAHTPALGVESVAADAAAPASAPLGSVSPSPDLNALIFRTMRHASFLPITGDLSTNGPPNLHMCPMMPFVAESTSHPTPQSSRCNPSPTSMAFSTDGDDSASCSDYLDEDYQASGKTRKRHATRRLTKAPSIPDPRSLDFAHPSGRPYRSWQGESTIFPIRGSSTDATKQRQDALSLQMEL